MRSISKEFFNVPVKIYNAKEIEKATNKEDLIDGDYQEDIDFAIGFMRIRPDDIVDWMDTYDRGKTTEDAKQFGFDGTQVTTKSDYFECPWPKAKFEQELQEFLDKSNADNYSFDKEILSRLNGYVITCTDNEQYSDTDDTTNDNMDK